jgi:hypothetical protein
VSEASKVRAQAALQKSNIRTWSGYEYASAARQNPKLVTMVAQKNRGLAPSISIKAGKSIINRDYLQRIFDTCRSLSLNNRKTCDEDTERVEKSHPVISPDQMVREWMVKSGQTGLLRFYDISNGSKKMVTGGLALWGACFIGSIIGAAATAVVASDYTVEGIKQFEAGVGGTPGSGIYETGPIVEIISDIHPIAGSIAHVAEEAIVTSVAVNQAVKLIEGAGTALGDGSVGVDEGAGGAEASKPYSKSRPSYGKGQVDEVWENAKDPLTGKVYDPTGKEITWDKSKPRNGQWDMGHIPGEKYSEMHELYMNGTISKEEFLEWYKNPDNYRPELPNTNRGHNYE